MAAETLVTQAKQLAKDGEHLRASAAYFKAAKKEPANPEILIELALSLLQLNKVSKALTAADDSIRLDPVCQKAHYVRGLALIGLKRLEDAIGALQQAADLGGDDERKSEAEAVLAQTKWQLKVQHQDAGTECPAVARDAELPTQEEPELSAKDKMAFLKAQHKKERQSKFAREQIKEKGTAVTEVLGELAKDAEVRAEHVTKELAVGAAADGETLRYSADRVTRFLDAQLHKLAEAQRDPEDAEQYSRPVAIILPGRDVQQEGGPKLVSTDGGLTYHEEGTSDIEGQGVAMTGAFESMAQQRTAIPFLRQMVEQTAAHAVVLLVPKAAVQYPKVWEEEDAAERWPSGEGVPSIETDGWYIQLDAKQPQDSNLWFLPTAEASNALNPNSRYALQRSFSLIQSAPLYQRGTSRQQERAKAKKKGKKGKKGRG
jgi:tetratricopeptide (TPR) repeat protein|eukprot:COSAG06_NODE_311_length_17771_cov_31.730647_8_plen_431_part_00